MRKSWLLLLAVLAVSALAYAPSLRGGFVWDDRALILEDESIHSFVHPARWFARDFFAQSEQEFKYGYYRPLITLSYALDWALWRDQPLGYRLTNLLWHLLATTLVFALAWRLSPRTSWIPASARNDDGRRSSRPASSSTPVASVTPAPSDSPSSSTPAVSSFPRRRESSQIDEAGVALSSVWAATLAAALFGLHPIHTESVAWIAGRTDVLCTALALAALLCWRIYLERNPALLAEASPAKKKKAAPAGRQGVGWLAASTALFLAALLAKEMGVVALPAAAWLAYLAVERPGRLKKLAPEFIAWGAALAVYLLLRQVVAGVRPDATPSEHTLWRAIATLPGALGMYLGKLAFPLRLSAYLSLPYVSHPFSIGGAVGLLALAGIGAALWRLGRRNAALAFALGGFLLSFAPLANLVRLSGPADMGFVTAERFLYLPSAFLCLAVAALLARRWTRAWGRYVLLAGGAIVALAFAVKTVDAGDAWRDEIALYRNALNAAPNAPLLWANLGAAYRRDGKLDDALAALRRAEEINGRTHAIDEVSVRNNLGTTLASLGRLDEALAEFDRAAALGKRADRVQFNRGEALRLLGRPDEALAAYDAALAVNGDYADARLRRAQMRLAKGDADGAETDLRAVLARSRNEPDALAGLAQIARKRGRLDEAAALLRRSLAQRPDDYPNLMALGGVLGQQQRFAEAAGPFEQALRLRPDAAQPYAALAAALFKGGARERAKQLLDEARGRFPNDVEALIGLLNYYYETQDLDRARQTLAAALALAPQHPQLRRYQQALGGP